jgi:hypothetical protein
VYIYNLSFIITFCNKKFSIIPLFTRAVSVRVLYITRNLIFIIIAAVFFVFLRFFSNATEAEIASARSFLTFRPDVLLLFCAEEALMPLLSDFFDYLYLLLLCPALL